MTMRIAIGLAAAALLGACAAAPRAAEQAGGTPSPAMPATPARERAPWGQARAEARTVPAAYATAWRAAANRDSCALLAPAVLPEELRSATPRAATFAGGWGVAYD